MENQEITQYSKQSLITQLEYFIEILKDDERRLTVSKTVMDDVINSLKHYFG